MKITENKPQVYSIIVCTHLRGKLILVLSVWSGSFHVSQLSLWWCHMAGFFQFTIKKSKTKQQNTTTSISCCPGTFVFSSFPVNYGGKKKVIFLLVRIVAWKHSWWNSSVCFLSWKIRGFTMVKFLQVEDYERFSFLKKKLGWFFLSFKVFFLKFFLKAFFF